MISVNSGSMRALEHLNQPQNIEDDRVTQALNAIKQHRVEVLESNPFRSYASHVQPMRLPLALDKVRFLELY